ncbi:MAG: DMT family transporter [Actinomycetota bacterium]|nr:DMT family transporter [Actinomycetota bacterium]MDP3631324.1 DMT family transporter [Actinomycetota bacterium]
MDRRVPLVAVVISAACFGTLAILTGLAYREGVSPLPLLAWRFALVTLLMAAYQLVRSPRALISGAADIGKYAALSLTGYGAASVCFFFALKYATASVVAVLLYTYPAMVALLSAAFLGERLTRNRIVAITLTFAGCALVVGLFSEKVDATLPGVLLGLGAALGYSVFNLLSYRVMGGRPRLVLMTYTFGISAVAIGILTIITGGTLSTAAWTPTLWWLLALIVVVPTFLAVLLYLNGVRRLGPAQAAIVSTTEPLFTIAMAAVFLGERLEPMQLAGAVLVVAGVVAAEWRQPRDGVHTEELAAV